jgi:uncharacterized RDD family membrane protein YckC
VLLFSVLFGAFGLGELGVDVGGFGAAFLYVMLFLLVFGYPAAFETMWRGRTPGKAALGLRVVTVEGAPIRFRHAAIRAILGIVDKYLFTGMVGVVSVLVTRRNQRVGDLVAGTIVLRERSGAKAPSAVRFDPPRGLEAFVGSLDVARLGHEDYGTIRSFLLRAPSLSPAARQHLAAQLAAPLVDRLRATPPPGVPPEAFLACVAAAHQQRNAPAAPVVPAFSSVWSSPEPSFAPPKAGGPAGPVTSDTGFTAPT